MSIVNKNGVLTDDEALAAALTSSSPVERIMARGASANWMPEFSAWINDEINRPEVDPVDFLRAVALLQLQAYASIAAQLIAAEGSETLVALYLKIAGKELRMHMSRVRQEGALA